MSTAPDNMPKGTDPGVGGPTYAANGSSGFKAPANTSGEVKIDDKANDFKAPVLTSDWVTIEYEIQPRDTATGTPDVKAPVSVGVKGKADGKKVDLDKIAIDLLAGKAAALSKVNNDRALAEIKAFQAGYQGRKRYTHPGSLNGIPPLGRNFTDHEQAALDDYDQKMKALLESKKESLLERNDTTLAALQAEVKKKVSSAISHGEVRYFIRRAFDEEMAKLLASIKAETLATDKALTMDKALTTDKAPTAVKASETPVNVVDNDLEKGLERRNTGTGPAPTGCQCTCSCPGRALRTQSKALRFMYLLEVFLLTYLIVCLAAGLREREAAGRVGNGGDSL